MLYLIWSFEHRSWWKPNKRGYTERLSEAGTYPKDEALEICEEANKYQSINEGLVPVDDRNFARLALKELD